MKLCPMVAFCVLLTSAATFVNGVPSATLTSVPAILEGNICPTTVQMTCTIEDIAILRWFHNENQLAAYLYTPGDTFPHQATLDNSQQGIYILITSSVPEASNVDLTDATSTLTTNLALLKEFNMQDITCGSGGTRSIPVTVNFDILVPPPPDLSATCSLVTSASGFDVSLQWSSSFNSQHGVERYRVSVDPIPSSSCASDRVMPNEDYSCPGLSPERSYSITVIAINCGDQKGETKTFTVLPTSLTGPRITSSGNVLPVFTPSGELAEIAVLWEHINQSVIFGDCSFSSEVNYEVVLEEDVTRNVQKIINSDTCVRSECNTSFDAPSNDNYIVKITATNERGESPTIVIEVRASDFTTEWNENSTAAADSSQLTPTTWTVAVGTIVGVYFTLLLIIHTYTYT